MKKRLSFLFYFFSTLLFSQDYVPLLDDYNEWQVTNCYFGCLTDVYYTDGDTIADGHNYKILDGYHFISRTILLREEILEKFPDAKTFPQIIVIGTKVGGYDKFVTYLNETGYNGTGYTLS